MALSFGPFVFRDHSSITSAKRWVGWAIKWQFLLIYTTIYVDVGGWVKRRQKHADVILESSLTVVAYFKVNEGQV